MTGMLNNPLFLQSMSSMLQNPAVMDQIIASNPELQAMGPQVREMFQSEQFRQLLCVVVFPLLSLSLCPVFCPATPPPGRRHLR